jgi:hypothetical protein
VLRSCCYEFCDYIFIVIQNTVRAERQQVRYTLLMCIAILAEVVGCKRDKRQSYITL